MGETLNTAFLISGGGTTAEAAVVAWEEGMIQGVEPALVVSNNPHAKGIERAEKHNIQTEVVQRKDYPNEEEFGRALLQLFADYQIDLIAQLGWLAKTPPSVVKEFQERSFNQHPGPLDPGKADFGGVGMYGLQAELAVLVYTWLTGTPFSTEATTHRVTEEYDKGGIIRRVPMAIPKPDRLVTAEEILDDPDLQKRLCDIARELQEELLPVEHSNVIETLRCFASGNVPEYIRGQPLIPEQYITTLNIAKQLAISLLSKR